MNQTPQTRFSCAAMQQDLASLWRFCRIYPSFQGLKQKTYCSLVQQSGREPALLPAEGRFDGNTVLIEGRPEAEPFRGELAGDGISGRIAAGPIDPATGDPPIGSNRQQDHHAAPDAGIAPFARIIARRGDIAGDLDWPRGDIPSTRTVARATAARAGAGRPAPRGIAYRAGARPRVVADRSSGRGVDQRGYRQAGPWRDDLRRPGLARCCPLPALLLPRSRRRCAWGRRGAGRRFDKRDIGRHQHRPRRFGQQPCRAQSAQHDKRESEVNDDDKSKSHGAGASPQLVRAGKSVGRRKRIGFGRLNQLTMKRRFFHSEQTGSDSICGKCDVRFAATDQTGLIS